MIVYTKYIYIYDFLMGKYVYYVCLYMYISICISVKYEACPFKHEKHTSYNKHMLKFFTNKQQFLCLEPSEPSFFLKIS